MHGKLKLMIGFCIHSIFLIQLSCARDSTGGIKKKYTALGGQVSLSTTRAPSHVTLSAFGCTVKWEDDYFLPDAALVAVEEGHVCLFERLNPRDETRLLWAVIDTSGCTRTCVDKNCGMTPFSASSEASAPSSLCTSRAMAAAVPVERQH